jgi:hypothetical protein
MGQWNSGRGGGYDIRLGRLHGRHFHDCRYPGVCAGTHAWLVSSQSRRSFLPSWPVKDSMASGSLGAAMYVHFVSFNPAVAWLENRLSVFFGEAYHNKLPLPSQTV